ncbi:hypothetical protein Tco_1540926 [Tanacetum coccineum]
MHRHNHAPDYDVLEDCMFMQLGRRSLRSEDWVEVAEKVSETCKMEINDGQCRTRFETLKLKHKKEKAKMEGSGMRGGMGGYYGKWCVVRMRMGEEVDEEGFKLLAESFRILARFMRRLRGGNGSRSWSWSDADGF